ncbi:MAG TPA: AsmA-like C-terminal domain-containing protein [Nitrospira sp.]|nr:AsmA-like C-terminal domain-containing protein [Nitrospira sp.]
MLTLNAADPQVAIRRDGEGHWHMPFVDDERTAHDSHHQWSLSDVVLRDGTLRIVDPRLNSGAVAVHHVQAALHSEPSDTQADVMFRGTTDDGGELHLAGTLEVTESDPSNRTLNKQFNGAVSFHNWNLPYWLERTAGYAVSDETAAQRGTISATIRADFPEHVDGFHVTASDVRVDTGWLAIAGDVVITDAGTEHPAYAMTFSASPVNSQTLLTHIPSAWLPDHIQAAVHDHQLAGTIQFQSVRLRGRMDVPRAPDEWRVAAHVADGSGRWQRKAFIRHLAGTVVLDPKHAELTNLSGEVNGVQVRSDKVGIAELDLIPALDARFNASGQVEQVVAVVKELAQGTEAYRVMQTITRPTGHVRAAVHLEASLQPNPTLKTIRAEMSLEDAGATFGSGVSVGGINGAFESDAHALAVKHLAGDFQGIRFEAQGNIDIDSGTRVNNLRVALSSDGAAMQNVLTAYLPAATGLTMDGPVRSTVQVSGTAAAVQCHGMIDVTQTEVSLPSIVHKPKGVRGRFEWEGKLFDQTRVFVDRFLVALSNGEVRAAGQVDLTPIPKFRWHIHTDSLSLHDLAEHGLQIPITDGIVHTSAAVTGEGANWKAWRPSGAVTIQRGRVAPPGHAEQVTDLQGRVRMTPQGVHLDDVSFRMGEADVRLTGTVEQWLSHPRARLIVESSQLNVSTLMPTTNSEPAGTKLQDWIRSKEATIAFIVKQLRYEQLVLKTVSGEIRVNEQRATLSELRAETSKGMLAGHVEARFAPEDRIALAARLSVDGLPAQHVLPAASGDKQPLQGDVSMDGVLHARIDSNVPLKNTLSTGHDGMAVKITSGRVQQDPVLTKALKILNLPALLLGSVDFEQEGIPFHSLSARVIATDGVLTSEDIVFDSPVIKVAGAGSANIGDNGLDLALAVSPVASYSDLLAQIPLLGPLVVGDHSGFTTAVFQAKGSLLNPDVAYLPLASVARGLSGYPRLAIDVLTRAIKLPPTALASLTE